MCEQISPDVLAFNRIALKAAAASALLSLLSVCDGAAQAQKVAAAPATNKETFLYSSIGVSTFCTASAKGVKWPNSLSIPVEVYAGLLKNVHDGKIADLKNKKPLSDKELVMGAEQQILLRAMAICPEFVPEDVQKQVKSVFEKMKKK